MKTLSVILVMLFSISNALAENSDWQLELNSIQGAKKGSACVLITESVTQAKTLAKALAAGNLAESLGSNVTTESELVTITNESQQEVNVTDTLNEKITVKSDHYLPNLDELKSGVYVIDGKNKYCVLVGIEK